jgi:cyclopropane-fatty-acyl-phospholipid synthase
MIQMAQPQLHELQSWDRWFRKLLFAKCRQMIAGQIKVIDADGEHWVGAAQTEHAAKDASVAPGQSSERRPAEEFAVLTVRHPRFYRRLVQGGNLAASEAWMDGDWTVDDLPTLIRIMVRNMNVTDHLDSFWGRARRYLERWGHWLRRNTPRSSRKNIQAHYDLGNEMFQLFLDPTMNYSSAIFQDLRPTANPESLHRAQLTKMDRICRALDLQPQDHLLEIGTGWGSLACYAAKHFGCRVTTTTISREQYDWAVQRVEAEGLGDRVTVLDQDYRALSGRFDKLVSVEMIEAVGDQYYPAFFQKCRSLLTADGVMLLQAITMVDQRYEQHLRSVDFICKYIFPGGSLPCISRLVSVAANSGEFRLVALQDFAEHYAETLRRWRKRFWQNIDAVRQLGYDERFVRMWDYYLAYCEAGFDERQINVSHLLFAAKNAKFDPMTAANKPQGTQQLAPPEIRESLAEVVDHVTARTLSTHRSGTR